MKKFSFQTILLVVFGFFIAFGVAVFAGYINIGSSSKNAIPTGSVQIWGTINQQLMSQYISTAGISNQNISVIYVEKSPETYELELISAFASGIGPDIFLVTPDIYWKQRDKMFETPYANYPAETYLATYMDVGKNYLTPTGIAAYPLFIDPLVGYWNKDLFASAGFAKPPQEWKEFPAVAEKISLVGNDFLISRSAVGLGEYTNIRHAKDILSLLFMQAGDPIMHADATGRLILDFGQQNNSAQNPAGVALDFYTQFANPTKNGVYSWNKLFSSDLDEFLAGNLAYYFGLGSELATIRQSNPNLNFDMTFVPQPNKNGSKTTVGVLYGVAISKQTKNLGLSYYVVMDMLAPAKNAALLTGMQGYGLTISPMRRDMIPNDPANIYATTLYQSALVAKAWVDPNPQVTSKAWEGMISDIQSGKSNTVDAIVTARDVISAYLETIQAIE
ncbi:MAG TPA: extracellular solute-binding protein [Candidatus Paceibacterota bacterium]|nr:extracellular solute-binding protein [Candidatus Paceibacterota bacterium]